MRDRVRASRICYLPATSATRRESRKESRREDPFGKNQLGGSELSSAVRCAVQPGGGMMLAHAAAACAMP